MAAKKLEKPSSFNEHYNEQDIAHVHSIIGWMNQSTNRTNRWLSRCVSVSDASISTLLTGKHGTVATELISKIIPVMADSERSHEPGEFVETSTWMVVQYACAAARREQGFAIIAGTPGVGKSESLLNYKRKNPNTIYMCGSEVINSTAVIDMLLEELGLKIARKERKSSKVAAIVELLKDTNRLIVLDEADKCQKDTPDPLRTISDQTGCGVVLAGNVGLRNMVKAGDNRYDLIESRVVFWPEVIHKISPQDVELLMRPYITPDLLSPQETYEQVAKYAFEVVDGSARKLVKSLIKNTLALDAQQRKQGGDYRGISRSMMRSIAQKFMGIAHPPTIARKASAVAG
jgi:DNA transposition AAA+ family ATPase